MAVSNGTITKRILKAAKNGVAGPELKREFLKHLHSFPLSSHKLVYDSDEGKMSGEVWILLLEAAAESDKAKFEEQNRWLVSMGGKPKNLPYGRYSG